MTAVPNEPTLSVNGPADLVCAVPYLLGFRPVDSLVVVGLDGSAVVVTIRLDLDVAVDDPSALDKALFGMRRGGATRFVGVVFDDDAAPIAAGESLPWSGLASAVVEAVMDLAGEPCDVLLVAAGRCWSYLCHGLGCCPEDGLPVSEAASEIPARATYAGFVALPDRAAVETLVEPASDDVRDAYGPALEAALEEAIAQISAGGRHRLDRADIRAIFAVARAEDYSEAAVARFGVALRRVEVRDSVWTAVDDGRLPADGLWRHLAHVLPAPYDAAPLFLLGWAAWRRGDGVLAQIAIERAVSSDPGYSAADLLGAILSSAVNPRSIPRIRQRGRRCGP